MSDMPHASALDLRALAVSFGASAAAGGLRDIALTVAAGERVAIVGPSGAGKTTLLRAIAGLAPITSGALLVDGTDVTALPPERRRCAYLHQSPVLFPHLDVFENVAFPLRVRQVPREAVRVRVHALLASLQLDGLERRSTDALSGGQRHRVALARALAADPRVLLLDEPLAALDPTLRDEVREMLGALPRVDSPAFLLVTHDFDDAALLADRVLVLLDGAIAQDATPAELFARPASLSVARFLGVANRLPAVIRGGNVRSPLGDSLATAFANGAGLSATSPETAAVRPCTIVAAADALRLTTDGPGVPGLVTSLRVRPTRTTVLVELQPVGDATSGTVVVECAVERQQHPTVGDQVHVSLYVSRALLYAEREPA